ncbi:wiskott-Aldrich syndrome protein family member 2 isoform X1 [Drosophila guanche]|uniref:wiskott-Aldrich syndrome protein family member 2 isoform X1 n=1 Tax=Drosophila guanche TaxID=7266 RepID=UPI001472193A|nr:wiskott-Aldrich syndrome protein family member 2 isoform X1 [Drosophila guanche]XP_034128557.1 wiskott-Aldrich syndrome protein family member 2 isoform X1 [Drosophila guanche]XP_034128559.1 wiskott-Aldrich syndrome protein family member 2 isoform X1 [Drosophila guanche]
MPLPKRSIEPVHVARSVYQQDELQSVELETVTNTTLTNIIRQLSSLSKHAEDVFGELARDVGSIGDRANSLQARIDRLAIKVTQLDSTVEEVPLTDITRKKAFKSAKIFDQQIFSRATMPAPMLETYAQCDKPPPLDKLNVYRDDGKDGLKFYTDPNYFFELWRQEMLKDTERVMHDKGKKLNRPRQDGVSGGAAGRGNKKQKTKIRAPHNTREKQRQLVLGHGETLMPNNVIYRTPNSMVNEEAGYGTQLVKIKTTVQGADNDLQQCELNAPHQVVSHLPDIDRDNVPDVDSVKPYNMLSHLEKNSNLTKQTAVAITDMGVYDTRPPRPNSIELRRSYQSEHVDGSGYEQLTPQAAANQYSTYGGNGMSAAPHMHMQHQQMYDAGLYQTHALYGQSGQNAMSPEPIYGPGTPSRNKPRPSQPPPAPPSNGSGGGTPTASNANTPTRGRSMSTSRDALPPPPPVPDAVSPLSAMNGANASHISVKLLGRTNSASRAGSPQMAPSNSAHNANDLVMAQLSNTFNSIGMTGNQLNSLSDLPPPPPVPDQHLPKMSSPNTAPPPPPPPPPVDEGMGSLHALHQHQVVPKTHSNGEIQQGQLNGGPQIVSAKKLLPPFHDPRNDLMKAIRDGITLRKVEKSEQKEIERNTAPLDVASILARRVAIELSESEDSDSEDDSEGWMEPNETSA